MKKLFSLLLAFVFIASLQARPIGDNHNENEGSVLYSFLPERFMASYNHAKELFELAESQKNANNVKLAIEKHQQSIDTLQWISQHCKPDEAKDFALLTAIIADSKIQFANLLIRDEQYQAAIDTLVPIARGVPSPYWADNLKNRAKIHLAVAYDFMKERNKAFTLLNEPGIIDALEDSLIDDDIQEWCHFIIITHKHRRPDLEQTFIFVDSVHNLIEAANISGDLDLALKYQEQVNDTLRELRWDMNTQEELQALQYELDENCISEAMFLINKTRMPEAIDILTPIAGRYPTNVPNGMASAAWLGIAHALNDNFLEASKYFNDPNVALYCEQYLRPEELRMIYFKVKGSTTLNKNFWSPNDDETDLPDDEAHYIEYLRKERDLAVEKNDWPSAASLCMEIITNSYLSNPAYAEIMQPDIDAYQEAMKKIDISKLSSQDSLTVANTEMKAIECLLLFDTHRTEQSLEGLIRECEWVSGLLATPNFDYQSTYLKANLCMLMGNLYLAKYHLKCHEGAALQAKQDIITATNLNVNAYALLLTYNQSNADGPKFDNLKLTLIWTLMHDFSMPHPSFINDFYNYISYNDLYSTFFQPIKNHIITRLLSSSSVERENMWLTIHEIFTEDMPRISNLAYYLKKGKSGMHGLAYDAALLSKGLLLKISQEMDRAIEESCDSELLTMLHLRDELAKKGALTPAGQAEHDKLEQQIVERLGNNTELFKKFDVRWEQVRDALEDNDVAIEFLQFPAFHYDSPTMKMTWAALKIKKGYETPEFILLNNLDSKLSANDDDQKSQDELWYNTAIIDTEIWQPLLQEEMTLGNKYRVFFAADGILHNIAIENSPGMAGNSRFELHRVASTREIVDGQQPLEMKSAAFFGDVAYDATREQVAAANANLDGPKDWPAPSGTSEDFLASIDKRLRGGRGSMYDPLPHSADEIALDAAALSRAGTACRIYDKSRATEEAFKSIDGHSPSIIHLATHGCYIQPEILEAEREYWNLSFASLTPKRSTSEDATLTHSFLTLAGSKNLRHNEMGKGLEDGHLTAQEIARLDLHDTRLVVLSACETALGDITNEGVLGLQRGFKRAGAGTIIMTVRQVGDASAKDFTVTFYDHLAGHHGEPAALRQAFAAARDHVRNKFRNDPNSRLDWAYFIMLD